MNSPIVKEISTANWFDSDEEFNNLYPSDIQVLARRHWTPLEVAKKAARFLAGEGSENILDIGSGVGKFCLAAAHQTPRAFYFGVEQRKSLIIHAEHAKNILQPHNVSFIYGNFTQLDFKRFDHFYFYNSFFENLDGTDKIDNSIAYSSELYEYYKCYLFRQLEQKQRGTRLCTLCVWDHEIPPAYHVVRSDMDEQLKFWLKI